MKSQIRAWVVFAVLCCLWGTIIASPFAYFAGMIREFGGLIFIQSFLPRPWQAILIYLLFAIVLSALLLLGHKTKTAYIAGICALAEMIRHLVECIKTGQVYPVSLTIAIGLALALLFLLIKPKSPGLWLSDAYIVSLSVWLAYDGVISTLAQIPGLSMSSLSAFIPVPDNALLTNLNDFLGLPMTVWAILPLLLGILPLIFLSSNRQKG